MRKFLVVAIVVLGAAIPAGIWLLGGREPPPTIRLGVNPWPGYEPLFLAKERGLFARHDLPIELVEFTSVGDCLRGFQQGDVDAMTCTLVEVALGRQINFAGPPIPILVTDSSRGADVILATPAVQRIPDLRGRRVGVEAASLGLFLLQRALSLHDVPREAITVVPLG